jgi:hypothetical protein
MPHAGWIKDQIFIGTGGLRGSGWPAFIFLFHVDPFRGFVDPVWGSAFIFLIHVDPGRGFVDPFNGFVDPARGFVDLVRGIVDLAWGFVNLVWGFVDPVWGFVNPFWSVDRSNFVDFADVERKNVADL